MAEEKPDPSVEVAQWLREVGGRRLRDRPDAPPACEVSERPNQTQPAIRRTLLLALLLVASLQYVYADTTVEILSLRSLLVFVSGER